MYENKCNEYLAKKKRKKKEEEEVKTYVSLFPFDTLNKRNKRKLEKKTLRSEMKLLVI